MFTIPKDLSFVNQENPQISASSGFPGRLSTSVHGKKNVLQYNIPNTEKCYSFTLNNHNARENMDVYYCVGCKSNASELRRNAKLAKEPMPKLSGYHVSIKVKDNLFMVDPCSLNHKCEPQSRSKSNATRKVYSNLLDIRENPESVLKKPRAHWNAILDQFEQDKAAEKEAFYGGGPYQRRVAISRALRKRKDISTTMENVVTELMKLDNGSGFVTGKVDEEHSINS